MRVGGAEAKTEAVGRNWAASRNLKIFSRAEQTELSWKPEEKERAEGDPGEE